MRIPADLDPGYFHQVGSHYILPFRKISQGSVLHLEQWNTNFFTISIALLSFVRVGMVFSSPYPVENGGGYLLTYSRGKAGKARSFDVMMRTDDIVIYSYHNCGALAVSPKINSKFQEILKEQ